jgi:hypothetical protein
VFLCVDIYHKATLQTFDIAWNLCIHNITSSVTVPHTTKPAPSCTFYLLLVLQPGNGWAVPKCLFVLINSTNQLSKTLTLQGTCVFITLVSSVTVPHTTKKAPMLHILSTIGIAAGNGWAVPKCLFVLIYTTKQLSKPLTLHGTCVFITLALSLFLTPPNQHPCCKFYLILVLQPGNGWAVPKGLFVLINSTNQLSKTLTLQGTCVFITH